MGEIRARRGLEPRVAGSGRSSIVRVRACRLFSSHPLLLRLFASCLVSIPLKFLLPWVTSVTSPSQTQHAACALRKARATLRPRDEQADMGLKREAVPRNARHSGNVVPRLGPHYPGFPMLDSAPERGARAPRRNAGPQLRTPAISRQQRDR
jgi:hypothetical protein